ncbi:MAG: non-ribosomal peptide synthetase, partial [Burkholderiales bacterium]|nr:non-ribosomal peptide synthetase [Burkholderiales bacterium]
MSLSADEINNIAFKQNNVELSFNEVLNLFKYFDKILEIHPNSNTSNVAIVFPDGLSFAILILFYLKNCNVIPLSIKHSTSEYESFLSGLSVDFVIIPTNYSTTSNIISAATNTGIRLISVPFIENIINQEKDWSIIQHDQHQIDELNFTNFIGTITLFTSGTTGKAKMVTLSYNNLNIAMHDAIKAYDLTKQDLCLSLLPLSHAHGLVACLLTPFFLRLKILFLTQGGFDSVDFFHVLEQQNPTWFAGVPTVFQSIIFRWEALKKPIIKHNLRFIRSASARIRADILDKLNLIFNNVPILQAYGMTESPSQVTTQQINLSSSPGSVGYPVSSEVQIRDENGDILECDQIGRVCIKGGSLFDGYVGKLKEESGFYSDGFFNTGDTGYLTKTGELFLVVRENDIINKGGEKINPLEIEEILIKHPAINEVVCFPVNDDYYGENVAIAIVIKNDKHVSESSIKEYIGYFVSEDKIPKVVHIVKEIPKNNMGKIQRRTLEAKLHKNDVQNNKTIQINAEDKNKVIRIMTDFFIKNLEIDKIEPTDNYFTMGGNSILAIRLINSINSYFSSNITVVNFLQSPTLENCILLLSNIDGIAEMPHTHSLERNLSDAQSRMLFIYEYCVDKSLYNLPVYYTLVKDIDIARLKYAITQVIVQNDALTSIIVSSTENKFLFVPQKLSNFFKLEEIILSNLEQLNIEIAKDSNYCFNLYEEIPIKIKLYYIQSSNQYYLFLNIHHIAFDGWSRQIFNQELISHYKNYQLLQNDQFNEAKISYSHFVNLQTMYAKNKIDNQKQFWRSYLDDYMYINLPYDSNSKTRLRNSYNGDNVKFKFSEEFSHRIILFAKNNGVSIYNLLLLGFQIMLSKYSGQSDITIGTTLANRNYANSENCLGLFANTLPIRMKFNDDLSIKDLISVLNQNLIDIQNNAEVSLEQIASILKRDNVETKQVDSIFSILFTLQPFSNDNL